MTNIKRLLYCSLIVCVVLAIYPPVVGAQNKVVVIPLIDSTAGTPAPVAKTGIVDSDVTGDDGDLEKGVAWPSPRFTDHSDGTVTDNLTGLVWLKNANCTEFFSGDGAGQNNRAWDAAVTACNSLANGYCGLSDGSTAGDWRLPNRFELESLLDLSQYDPALPLGHPFTDVASNYYWTSSPFAGTTVEYDEKWDADLTDGYVEYYPKTDEDYVWPVRDGN